MNNYAPSSLLLPPLCSFLSICDLRWWWSVGGSVQDSIEEINMAQLHIRQQRNTACKDTYIHTLHRYWSVSLFYTEARPAVLCNHFLNAVISSSRVNYFVISRWDSQSWETKRLFPLITYNLFQRLGVPCQQVWILSVHAVETDLRWNCQR